MQIKKKITNTFTKASKPESLLLALLIFSGGCSSLNLKNGATPSKPEETHAILRVESENTNGYNTLSYIAEFQNELGLNFELSLGGVQAKNKTLVFDSFKRKYIYSSSTSSLPNGDYVSFNIDFNNLNYSGSVFIPQQEPKLIYNQSISWPETHSKHQELILRINEIDTQNYQTIKLIVTRYYTDHTQQKTATDTFEYKDQIERIFRSSFFTEQPNTYKLRFQLESNIQGTMTSNFKSQDIKAIFKYTKDITISDL